MQRYVQAKTFYDGRRYGEALRLYEELASMNPADGRVPLLIGDLYWWGAGTKLDPAQAERWLERAARLGENRAYLHLAGICSQQGRPDRERTWLEEGAAKGYAPAIHYLGSGWEFGRWGRIDRARALECYVQAGAKGYCRATWRMSVSLLRGERGLLRVPLGLVMFVASWAKLLVLLYRDPYDERVMW